jgi:hypothetical protein
MGQSDKEERNDGVEVFMGSACEVQRWRSVQSKAIKKHLHEIQSNSIEP